MSLGADVEILKLDRRPPAEAAGVGYQVVVLAGAGWRDSDIEEAVGEASAVFASCDVAVHATAVYWVKAPAGYQELDEREQAGLLAPLGGRRPVALFVNRTTERDIAYSYLNTAPVASRGTAWITRDSAPSCVGPLLAHELGHILLNSGRHVDDQRNLMSYNCVTMNITGFRLNTELTEGQCKRLQARVAGRPDPGTASGRR